MTEHTHRVERESADQLVLRRNLDVAIPVTHRSTLVCLMQEWGGDGIAINLPDEVAERRNLKPYDGASPGGWYTETLHAELSRAGEKIRELGDALREVRA